MFTDAFSVDQRCYFFLDVWMHCIGVQGQCDGQSIGYNDYYAVSIALMHSIKVLFGVCIYQ